MSHPRKPPTGLQALFWRMPIAFFHLHLDFLFGERLLLLHHIGRKSGKDREAVIEVARVDEAHHTYYVCSGFGTESHWYRNIDANPYVTLQIAGHEVEAKAHLLDPQESGLEMLRYVEQHPRLAPQFARILGLPIPDSPEGYRQLAEEYLPFVAFEVIDT